MIFGEAVGWAVLVVFMGFFFVVSLVLFFDVDVVFFYIITGFFVSTIRRQSTNIFFSLIFPLFFHFDGPFPQQKIASLISPIFFHFNGPFPL